jgi:hypothetical protein
MCRRSPSGEYVEPHAESRARELLPRKPLELLPDGVAAKLKRSLERTLGRLNERR